MPIVSVALPVPMRSCFDYLSAQPIELGCRVWVPFGNRKLVGIVVGYVEHSQIAIEKLKPIEQVIDSKPVFSTSMRQMCEWLSRYYHYSLGAVMHTALPVHLRQGKANEPTQAVFWQVTPTGKSAMAEDFKRAKKQWSLLLQIQQGELADDVLKQCASSSVINGLLAKELIQKRVKPPTLHTQCKQNITLADKPKANIQQALAISTISASVGDNAVHLLEGVTGSGKTEVYLQAIEPVLLAGQQILLLVPEIGLTPQTVHRFQQRFGLPVAQLHSNENDTQRLTVWQQAGSGEAAIVIGTRSAIFTPFARLGMIIVDEEHDLSYKQHDGLRYHARDLAVIRAKQEAVPLVLGSATPSLETLNNALSGRYQHLLLSQQAENSASTAQHLFDLRGQAISFGLANSLLNKIKQHLAQGNQVLVFANRRGYAPALLCHHCGHVFSCNRCDKPFTVHKSSRNLQCHHCGAARSMPTACEQCASQQLVSEGVGTEQLEAGLRQIFCEHSVVRIDSDSVRRKGRLQQLIDEINQRQHQILIGTQILSKGHHFPHVTLVIILDVDVALYSADYRAAEHLAQLITQLSGRAGRADKPGEMWLQTHEPSHPLLQDLLNNGYQHFARYALLERQHAKLPPYYYQALCRAEASQADMAYSFLQQVSDILNEQQWVTLIGPLPALIEKRQGRFRFQLLLQSDKRQALQHVLSAQLTQIEALPLANRVRWSLDIDPQDFS